MSDKPKKSEKRRRNAMVSVRFTSDEFRQVCEKAASIGSSVSGYIRDVALGPPAELPFRVDCCVCGGLIVATDNPDAMGYNPFFPAPTDRAHLGCVAA